MDDMGIIKEINEYAETMTVEFDEGRMVDYSLKNLENSNLPMRSPFISRRDLNIRQL